MIDDMEEIWVLYADDGAQALDTAEEALAAIASGGAGAMAEGVSSLFRAVHTFKGNARVLGLRNAEKRAHVTEDLIGLVRDQGAPWDDEMAQILVLAIDRLRAILEQTATHRSDIDDSFGADLMQAVLDKIERLTGRAVGAEVSEDIPLALPVAEVEVPAFEEDEAAEEVAAPRSALEQQAAELMAQIVGPLSQLSELRAQPDAGEACAQILRNIAGQAEAFRFFRLADTALALAGKADGAPPLADARLYEELNAIELSLPEGALPDPRPKAIYQEWCANNAQGLLLALHDVLRPLSNGPDAGFPQSGLTQALRRLSRACQHHELATTADWAVALLDLLTLWDGTAGKAAGETLVQILRAFANILGAVLPADADGHTSMAPPPVIGTSQGVFDDDSLTASAALALPPQFLRAMAPQDIATAWQAVQNGARHWVARLDLAHLSGATPMFYSRTQSGALRLVAAVAIRADTAMRLDVLVETRLSPSEVETAFLEIASPGSDLRLEQLTTSQANKQTERLPQPARQAGVSVEMLEMLGEVSTGLTQIALRLGSVVQTRNGDHQRAKSLKIVSDQSYLDIIGQLNHMGDEIEDSIKALDDLAHQVGDLQEDAIASRLRPVSAELADVIADLEREVRLHAPLVSLSVQSDDMLLDGQTLELIGKLCAAYLPDRTLHCTTETAVLSITLRQREDRAILMVTDHLPDPTDSETLSRLRRLATGSGGRIWTQVHDDGRHGLVVSLPTRALAMEAMIVQSGNMHYGLPVDSLVMVQYAGPDRILRRAAAGASRFLRLDNGEVLTIVTLETRKVDQGGIFVILQASGRRKALLVDTLLGHQVVRLRPLQGIMEKLDKLAGFAVLAGGQIASVLSPLAICHDNDLSHLVFDAPEAAARFLHPSPRKK